MNIGHLNKFIISYRNMIDSELILVPEYNKLRNEIRCGYI